MLDLIKKNDSQKERIHEIMRLNTFQKAAVQATKISRSFPLN